MLNSGADDTGARDDVVQLIDCCTAVSDSDSEWRYKRRVCELLYWVKVARPCGGFRSGPVLSVIVLYSLLVRLSVCLCDFITTRAREDFLN